MRYLCVHTEDKDIEIIYKGRLFDPDSRRKSPENQGSLNPHPHVSGRTVPCPWGPLYFHYEFGSGGLRDLCERTKVHLCKCHRDPCRLKYSVSEGRGPALLQVVALQSCRPPSFGTCVTSPAGGNRVSHSIGQGPRWTGVPLDRSRSLVDWCPTRQVTVLGGLGAPLGRPSSSGVAVDPQDTYVVQLTWAHVERVSGVVETPPEAQVIHYSKALPVLSAHTLRRKDPGHRDLTCSVYLPLHPRPRPS